MSEASTGTRDPSDDGRLRRSERSREAMVRAMFDLIGEGELRPTARQVADRAGVGIRTVFRHFSDMETLYVEMDRMLREEAGSFLAMQVEQGDLAERAASLVRFRVAAFERFEPYLRSTRLHRRRSPFLQRSYADLVAEQSATLQRCLPELESAPRDWVDAMEAATSFDLWDDLRSTRGLGKARARSAMERMVRALADELG